MPRKNEKLISTNAHCKICLKNLTRNKDFNCVEGKPFIAFNIGHELERLAFKVPSTSPYCCYWCRKMLKKRLECRKVINEIDEKIFRLSHGIDLPNDNDKNKDQNKEDEDEDDDDDDDDDGDEDDEGIARVGQNVAPGSKSNIVAIETQTCKSDIGAMETETSSSKSFINTTKISDNPSSSSVSRLSAQTIKSTDNTTSFQVSATYVQLAKNTGVVISSSLASKPSIQIIQANKDNSKVRIIAQNNNQAKEHDYCNTVTEKQEPVYSASPVSQNTSKVIICLPTASKITNFTKGLIPPLTSSIPGLKTPSEPRLLSSASIPQGMTSTVNVYKSGDISITNKTVNNSTTAKLQPHAFVTKSFSSIYSTIYQDKARNPIDIRNASTQTKEAIKDLFPLLAGFDYNSTTACIYVKWPSGSKQRILPRDLTGIGIALLRGNHTDIARRIWKHEKINKQLKYLLTKDIIKEADTICDDKVNSILRKASNEDILSFTFERLDEELQKYCPTLRNVLKTVATKKNYEDDMSWLTAICLAASLCLKNRQPKMFALQKMLDMLEDGEKEIMPRCLLKHRYIYIPPEAST